MVEEVVNIGIYVVGCPLELILVHNRQLYRAMATNRLTVRPYLS
jgi:hypothetical protein